MTDYRKQASAAGLEPELHDRVVPTLERLEAIFRPLADALPLEIEPDLRFVAAEDPE